MGDFDLRHIMLKRTFFELTYRYNSDLELAEKLWFELVVQYSNKNRYYHNLTHLEHLLTQLTEIKSDIDDWDTVLFSLYYHDVIYSSKSQKNEENSADLAKKRLLQIGYPQLKTEHCFDQIIATKSHDLSNSHDTNLFTDADLSILGAEWSIYHTYTDQIRQEYAIYPDFMYKPGRKNILLHFLKMERIFKTDYFYTTFEIQARKNIEQELEIYS